MSSASSSPSPSADVLEVHLHKVGGKFNRWKRRFFYIRGYTFFYCDTNSAADRENPLGAIRLSDVLRVAADDVDRGQPRKFRGLGIEIQTMKRVFHVCAESAEDRDRVIDTLRSRRSMCNSRQSFIASGTAPLALAVPENSDDEDGDFSGFDEDFETKAEVNIVPVVAPAQPKPADHLQLVHNKAAMEILAKYGDRVVEFSANGTLFEESKPYVFCMTDAAMYVMATSDYAVKKRCDFRGFTSVFMDGASILCLFYPISADDVEQEVWTDLQDKRPSFLKVVKKLCPKATIQSVIAPATMKKTVQEYRKKTPPPVFTVASSVSSPIPIPPSSHLSTGPSASTTASGSSGSAGQQNGSHGSSPQTLNPLAIPPSKDSNRNSYRDKDSLEGSQEVSAESGPVASQEAKDTTPTSSSSGTGAPSAFPSDPILATASYMEFTDYDYLNVARTPAFASILQSYGEKKVYLSVVVEKANRSHIRQKRYLVVCDKAAYNMTLKREVKRIIPLSLISAVWCDEDDPQMFAIVVSSENDYLLYSDKRTAIGIAIEHAEEQFALSTGQFTEFAGVSDMRDVKENVMRKKNKGVASRQKEELLKTPDEVRESLVRGVQEDNIEEVKKAMQRAKVFPGMVRDPSYISAERWLVRMAKREQLLDDIGRDIDKLQGEQSEQSNRDSDKSVDFVAALAQVEQKVRLIVEDSPSYVFSEDMRLLLGHLKVLAAQQADMRAAKDRADLAVLENVCRKLASSVSHSQNASADAFALDDDENGDEVSDHEVFLETGRRQLLRQAQTAVALVTSQRAALQWLKEMSETPNIDIDQYALAMRTANSLAIAPAVLAPYEATYADVLSRTRKRRNVYLALLDDAEDLVGNHDALVTRQEEVDFEGGRDLPEVREHFDNLEAVWAFRQQMPALLQSESLESLQEALHTASARYELSMRWFAGDWARCAFGKALLRAFQNDIAALGQRLQAVVRSYRQNFADGFRCKRGDIAAIRLLVEECRKHMTEWDLLDDVETSLRLFDQLTEFNSVVSAAAAQPYLDMDAATMLVENTSQARRKLSDMGYVKSRLEQVCSMKDADDLVELVAVHDMFVGSVEEDLRAMRNADDWSFEALEAYMLRRGYDVNQQSTSLDADPTSDSTISAKLKASLEAKRAILVAATSAAVAASFMGDASDAPAADAEHGETVGPANVGLTDAAVSDASDSSISVPVIGQTAECDAAAAPSVADQQDSQALTAELQAGEDEGGRSVNVEEQVRFYYDDTTPSLVIRTPAALAALESKCANDETALRIVRGCRIIFAGPEKSSVFPPAFFYSEQAQRWTVHPHSYAHRMGMAVGSSTTQLVKSALVSAELLFNTVVSGFALISCEAPLIPIAPKIASLEDYVSSPSFVPTLSAQSGTSFPGSDASSISNADASGSALSASQAGSGSSVGPNGSQTTASSGASSHPVIAFLEAADDLDWVYYCDLIYAILADAPAKRRRHLRPADAMKASTRPYVKGVLDGFAETSAFHALEEYLEEEDIDARSLDLESYCIIAYMAFHFGCVRDIIAALSSDVALLEKMYEPHAVLRDTRLCRIILDGLTGLDARRWTDAPPMDTPDHVVRLLRTLAANRLPWWQWIARRQQQANQHAASLSSTPTRDGHLASSQPSAEDAQLGPFAASGPASTVPTSTNTTTNATTSSSSSTATSSPIPIPSTNKNAPLSGNTPVPSPSQPSQSQQPEVPVVAVAVRYPPLQAVASAAATLHAYCRSVSPDLSTVFSDAPPVSRLVRSTLCNALADVLLRGFKLKTKKMGFFGRDFALFDVFALPVEKGDRVTNRVKAAVEAVSEYLEERATRSVRKVDEYTLLGMKLRALICYALNYGILEDVLEDSLRETRVLRKVYDEMAPIFDDDFRRELVKSVSILRDVRFSLDLDHELR